MLEVPISNLFVWKLARVRMSLPSTSSGEFHEPYEAAYQTLPRRWFPARHLQELRPSPSRTSSRLAVAPTWQRRSCVATHSTFFLVWLFALIPLAVFYSASVAHWLAKHLDADSILVSSPTVAGLPPNVLVLRVFQRCPPLASPSHKPAVAELWKRLSTNTSVSPS